MEVSRLDLYGHTFVECFTLTQDFRATSEMKNDACLAYIQEGTQQIFSPTQKITATDQESILMKCGSYIANFENLSSINQFKSVVFHLDPDAIKLAFGESDISFLKVKRDKAIDPALKIGKNDLLNSFVDSMSVYFDNPQIANDRILAAKLQELVLILSDGGKNEIATQILGTLYTKEHLALEEIIQANLYNKMSVAELAHLANRSESTFKRDFKKFYQTTPAKYFRQKKLSKAAELLSRTEMPISTIAWDCGFDNADHFSSTFNKEYGKTPSGYRSASN